MASDGSYDEKYQNSKSYWGDGPSRLVAEYHTLFVPGTLIDVGAGDGRDAIFLAERGFKVTALEIAPAGLARIKEKAAAKKLLVETIEGDIRHLELPQTYDNVVASFLLHFLGETHILPTLEKLASATKPGGINFIDDFTQNSPFAAGHPQDFITKQLLASFYEQRGWEILITEMRLVGTEASGRSASHQACLVIAKKPR